MAKKWSELSKKQQKKQKEKHGSRKEYQAAKQKAQAAKPAPKPTPAPAPSPSPAPTPSRSPSPTPTPSRSSSSSPTPTPTPSAPPTQKWSDMSQKEQKQAKEDYGTREKYQAAKQKAQEVKGTDFSQVGKGSTKSKNIVSKKDLKTLVQSGTSKQEVINMVEGSNAKIGGAGAESLLAKYKANLKGGSTSADPKPAETGSSTTPQQEQVSLTESVNQKVNSTNAIQNSIGSSTTVGEGTNTSTVVGGTGTGQNVQTNQSNSASISNSQNNDLNVSINGNNNTTSALQDNSIKNSIGNQSNSSSVSQQTQAQELLQNYIDGEKGQSGFQEGVDNDSSSLAQNLVTNQSNTSNMTNTQNNDINANITGDGNVTNINQDNSIRNYGGDNRNFTYVSQGNALLDNPVSAATMAGYYKTGDSPAKSAAFVDRYQTMNSDAQKKYSGSGTAAKTIAAANELSSIDTKQLDMANRLRPEISRARHKNAMLNIFGDMYKMNTPTWGSAERPDPVKQPDFEAMFDKYTDF